MHNKSRNSLREMNAGSNSDYKGSRNKSTLKQLHDKYLTCVSDGLTDNIRTHIYSSMYVVAFSRQVHYLHQPSIALNSAMARLTKIENVWFCSGGFSYPIPEKFIAWRVNSTLNFTQKTDSVILVSLAAVSLAASRNVPPHKRLWGGALRDDAKNGCEGD